MLPSPASADPSAFHPQLAAVDDVLHVRPRTGVATTTTPLVEVAQIWSGTVLGVRHLAPGEDALWIGDTTDHPVDFFASCDELPSDRWALVVRTPKTATLRLHGRAVAFRHRHDERAPFWTLVERGEAQQIDGAWHIPLAPGDQWVVEQGGGLFLIRTVAAADAVPPAPLTVDWLFGGVLVALLFLAVALGITLTVMPYDPSREAIDVPEHFVRLILEQQEKQKKKAAPARQEDAGPGEKAKDEPGKVGDKESTLRRAKGPRIAQNRAELNKQIAMKAGLLADLDLMDDNDIFGADGLGQEVTSALGGLIGAVGRQAGVGGLAGRGTWTGGGGPAKGIGGVGLHGDKFGREGGGHLPGIDGPTKPGGSPTVGSRDPIILGALDKSLIDEVVKKKLPAIRYCYQRELNKQPALAGKLVMKFTIDKRGGVSAASSKSSTLRNPVVEACVRKQFLRMRFPPPRGGGIVIVSYPFVFDSAG